MFYRLFLPAHYNLYIRRMPFHTTFSKEFGVINVRNPREMNHRNGQSGVFRFKCKFNEKFFFDSLKDEMK